MGVMFVLVPVFIGAVFLLVFGTIAVAMVRGFTEWTKNNAQPVQTVPVRVVTKRQHISGGGEGSSASTWYYVTFEQLAGGDRQEFRVGSEVFSGVAEGDHGRLTFQGTRFHRFERDRNPAPAAVPEITAEPRRCAYCEGRVPAGAEKCPACGAREFR